MTRSRWTGYVALSGAAVAAIVFTVERSSGPGEPLEVVGAVPRAVPLAAGGPRSSGSSVGSGAAAGTGWVPLLPRAELWQSALSRTPVRDLFARHSAPPATVAAPLPVAPQAPPLPFAVLGKRHDGQHWDVFLGRGDLTFIVREGTVIEHTYRVETIRPPTLTMTYLPLSQSQPLTIGGAD